MSGTDDTRSPTYSERRSLDVWGESHDYGAELINHCSDGWDEVFKLSTVAGIVVVAGLTIRPSGNEVPISGLTSTRLRKVKIGKALDDAHCLSESAEDHAPMPRALSRRPDNVGRRRTKRSEVLLLVAELHRVAVASGSKRPVTDVFHELASRGTQRAYGTVRNDVYHARMRGLIPPRDAAARAAEDTEYAQPVLEAGARALEVARWRLADDVRRPGGVD